MPECQFPVFCCFWFQKSYTENILGIARNLFCHKCEFGKLPESGGHLEETPRVPRHTRARPRWDPCRAMVRGPHLASDASPSPIYSPSHENPRRMAHIPRKVPSRSSSSISDRRCSEALLGTLPEGRSSPEASTPPCLPPE